MNLSGESVSGDLLDYYKAGCRAGASWSFMTISAWRAGHIRIRTKGSAGGHNGIKNIIAHLGGTRYFPRIKVGVGEKPPGWDLADYVLGRFSDEDRKKVNDAIEDAIGAVSMILRGETDQAMN